MSFRRRAGGGKRDIAEGPILAALRAVGVRCWVIGGTGNPDVLCLLRGVYTPLEIKTGKGKRTANQRDIPWPVVNTPEQAIAAVTTKS